MCNKHICDGRLHHHKEELEMTSHPLKREFGGEIVDTTKQISQHLILTCSSRKSQHGEDVTVFSC